MTYVLDAAGLLPGAPKTLVLSDAEAAEVRRLAAAGDEHALALLPRLTSVGDEATGDAVLSAVRESAVRVGKKWRPGRRR